MSYKMTIELSDRDLRHFRRELHKTRESVQIADDEEILAAAVDLVTAMRRPTCPISWPSGSTSSRPCWPWPATSSGRSRTRNARPILAGLAYLCDPEDLIPDDIPGIGMLDDAVMIELVFRELEHELEAYDDFRKYRAQLLKDAAKDDPAKIQLGWSDGSAAAGADGRRRKKSG